MSKPVRKRAANGDGSKWLDRNGYVVLTLPNIHGRIMEHRYVMEQQLGRLLYRNEYVHHRNGIKTDNRPENLELWISSQPSGQRVEDMVKWALEILAQYGTGSTGWIAK